VKYPSIPNTKDFHITLFNIEMINKHINEKEREKIYKRNINDYLITN